MISKLLTPDLIDHLVEYIAQPWSSGDVAAIANIFDDQMAHLLEEKFAYFRSADRSGIYFVLSHACGCPQKCRSLLIDRRRQMFPEFDDMISAASEGKSAQIWQKTSIPPLFAGIDIYADYLANPDRHDDFEKYYKTYGMRLVSSKWGAKFADLKPVSRSHKNAIVPEYIFNIFVQVFNGSDHQKNDICWPFVSNIVPSADVRNDPAYPLCVSSDIIKLHHICSYFLDIDERDAYLRKFVATLMHYSRADVWYWRDSMAATNPKYAQLLAEEDKKKSY